VTDIARHFRIFAALMRYGLARELSFRANFVVYVLTELLWLAMLVIFYEVVFGRTSAVGGWTREQMMVLIGTHFVVTRIFQGLFFESCIELADLIRTGRLDFLLVKPVDPQFLISVSKVDYSSLINVFFGLGLVGYGLERMGLRPGPADMLCWLLLVGSGVIALYSLMFLLCTTAFWAVRTQFIYEGWFHLTGFGRYPETIYRSAWLRFTLTYLFPVLAVANWPARQLLSDDPDKLLEPWQVLYAVAAAGVLLAASTLFFRRALRSYRSGGY
jgi:ABC-2 type transport system permease protein